MGVTILKYDRLLTFDSVHQATGAKKILAGAGKKATEIPTPRKVDINCGLSLLFFAEEEQEVLALLKSGGIRWIKLFALDEGCYKELEDGEG